MIEIKKDSFDDLLFPVHEMPNLADPKEHFPKIQEYPEYVADLGKIKERFNVIFRYLVLAYDQKSPFVVQIDDLIRRKKEVAEYVQFPKTANGYPDWVKDIMQCKNATFVSMIVRYCRMQFPMKFSHLIANTEAYYNIMEEMITKRETKDPEERMKIEKVRMDLTAKTKDLIESIDTLGRELLVFDQSPELQKELWEKSEEEAKAQIKITPEDYAGV